MLLLLFLSKFQQKHFHSGHFPNQTKINSTLISSLKLIGSEIRKITTKTKNVPLFLWDGTTDKINFKICQNGDCCQTKDMPLKNQSRGDINEFSGTEISNCHMKKLYFDLTNVKLTVTKTGTDRWGLLDVHIETKFKSTYQCNFNKKIDNYPWSPISGQGSSTSDCTGTYTD